MVTIETEEGTLYVDGKFSYKMQNADIGDISKSATNHTNSFSVRRDKNSTRILKGLGLEGSQSDIPYVKNEVRLNLNGVTIVRSGRMEVTSSDKDSFKISVFDGNVDFWKMIEGKNLSVLDLHETKHTKTPTHIVQSFNNPYYKYFLGDYGGELNENTNEYNGDQLIPSINEQYLFDRVFSYFGVGYTAAEVNIETWLTYGKATGVDVTYDTPISLALDGGNIRSGANYFDANPVLNPLIQPGVIYLPNNGRVKGLNPGQYKVEVNWTKLKGHSAWNNLITNDIAETPVAMEFYINNQLKGTYIEEIDNGSFSFDVTDKIMETDELYFKFKTLNKDQYKKETGVKHPGRITYYDMIAEGLHINFKRQIEEVIDFAESLSNVTIKEYIKSIMYRYGLTLFYSASNNSVTFMTTSERVNADSQDLPIIERITEKYVYRDYAQKNILHHKYINKDNDFNDGIIRIENENLEEERQALESFTYSPTRDGKFLMYEQKVKKDGSSVEIEYKPVENRNFVATYYSRSLDYGRIYSNLIASAPDVSLANKVVPFISDARTTFKYFAPLFYEAFEKLLTEAKIHRVSLHMSFYKFILLDMKKKVYVEKEASYYLINSIQIKDNYEVEAELIKIN